MKKRVLAAILSAVMAASLAACGGSAASTATTSAATTSTAATSTAAVSTAATSAAASAGTASTAATSTATTAGGNPVSEATTEKGGDTVVLALNDTFTTTDDFNNFSMVNKHLHHLWADTLFEMDFDTGKYIPALTESYKWSDDNLTLSVTIRKGVMFSNGDEMKGEDVAFSYQRVADGEGLSNTMSWGKLKGAKATGDYSADIYFDTPMPIFYCESCNLPIICKAAYEKDPKNFWNAPVGSGPYKWTATDFVNNTGTLEFWNKDWWGYKAYNKEPGNVKNVKFEKIDEDTTRVSSLRTNEIQIAMKLPYADIDTVKGDGLQVLTNNAGENVWLCINVDKVPALQNVKARQAMSMAIDRDAIVKSIVGNGTTATWAVGEKDMGYSDGWTYEYDPEKAASLLKESGYDGSAITFEISTGTVTKGSEVAQAVASYLQAVGFNVSITQSEQSAWNDNRFSGNYQMQLCQFTYTNNETWKIMDEIVGRTDFFKMNLKRDEAWKVFDEAMLEMDAQARDKLMQKGYALVMEDYDPIYLYDNIACIGVASNLSGVVLNPDSTMELRYMTLK